MTPVKTIDRAEIIPFFKPVSRIAAGLISLISETTLQIIRCLAFIDNEYFNTLKNPAPVMLATGMITASKFLSFISR